MKTCRNTCRRRTLRSWLLVAIAAAGTAPLDAQSRRDVRGTVADSSGMALGGAMVVALALPDSTLMEFSTTGGDGAFMLRGLAPGEYLLQVSLIGYGTVRDPLTIAGEDVDAGTISLAVMAVEIDPLVVTLDHVPFLNRRDTLGYNALAFETRPNATVEDLLRRLPGIEVDEDGSITAQGEEVQNVLVDGREFFGTDPTIATRNLRADAVERVQVYDRESDMAEFTGIADGEEERTINLELREEARRGYFGRVAGSLGADMGDYEPFVSSGLDTEPVGNRTPYDGTFSLNRFSPTTQLAALGNVNNLGEAGFGWQDLQGFAGGARALTGGFGARGGGDGGGSDDGFTESMALGLNASHDFADRTWIRTSYFLSSIDNLQNTSLQQQLLFGSDVSSQIDETSTEKTDNLSHRVNVNAQVTLAEGHDLRLRGNLNAGSSMLSELGFRETFDSGGGVLNSSLADYLVDGDDLGGNAQLTWRKRLSDSGRSIVAEARANLSDSDLFADLSSTVVGDPDDPSRIDQAILQEQTSFGRTFGHSLRLSMTNPLGGGNVLEVFGERSATDQDEDKSVFDIVQGSSVFNDRLSSGFERLYTYLRGGFRFSRNSESTRLVLGMQLQNSDLNGTIVDRSEEINNGYTHVLPNADLRVQLADSKTLNFRYTTRTNEPSMTQLQPFVDNSNPVNIFTGNPDLQPEYTHRLNVDYRFFDQFSFLNLFTYANVSLTTNDITQARTVDAQGRQSVSPVNTGRAWNTNLGANLGTPIRPLGLRISVDYNGSLTRGTELVNGAENRSRILQNRIGLTVENRDKDRFDLRGGTRLTHNNVDYSLNEELDQSYINTTWFANGSLYLGPWTLESSMNFRTFDQDVFGQNRSVALWEASLSRLFMNDRAELELVAFDILNQNQGVNFSSSATSISERRTQTLSQYVMLRLTWHMGPRGGPGGRGGPRGDFRRQ